MRKRQIPFHLSTTRNENSLSHPTPSPSPSQLPSPHYYPQERPKMKSSSDGPSGNPRTSSDCQFASISPSSYRNYNPEWASVSPPALASSFNDHPESRSPPPRQKLCHLLNPTFCLPPSSSGKDVVGSHPSSAPLSITTNSNPKYAALTYTSSLHSPTEIPQNASCSLSPHESPHDAHASSNFHLSEDQEVGPYEYPVATNPQPMLLDGDRPISSRPLKNTKRAAQNRAAQRAFRERKDRYVRELEARSTQFEAYILRYGLLEERERLLEAREAELMYHSAKANLSEEGLVNHGSKVAEQDKKDYITKLEEQLEDCRREIIRLRSKLYHNEDMDKANRKDIDWERGSEDGFVGPRTGSASDADTGGHASCSSGSPCAWNIPKALPVAHHDPEWIRNDRITSSFRSKISDEANGNNGLNYNRQTTSETTIQSKREAIQSESSSRLGWSDGSRSPVSLSLPHQQKHSDWVKPLSEDCDRMARRHLPSPELYSQDVPFHRSNNLDRQIRPVRLPGIHHHLNQIWREDAWKK